MVPALAKPVQLLQRRLRQDQGGTGAGQAAGVASLIAMASSFRPRSISFNFPGTSRIELANAGPVPEDDESEPRCRAVPEN
jgi:hypothetical protein